VTESRRVWPGDRSRRLAAGPKCGGFFCEPFTFLGANLRANATAYLGQICYIIFGDASHVYESEPVRIWGWADRVSKANSVRCTDSSVDPGKASRSAEEMLSQVRPASL
jgi:hypothetical protein